MDRTLVVPLASSLVVTKAVRQVVQTDKMMDHYLAVRWALLLVDNLAKQ